MTPGLAGPPFPAKAKKDAIVAIASLEEPSVPVAVGTCVIDVANLQTTQGAKGQAVETFHWAGDELWDWSTSGRSGVAAPKEIAEWLGEESEQLAEAMASTTIDDDEDETGGVALDPGGPEREATTQRNDHVEGEDAPASQLDDGGSPKMTTADIDDAFLNAFLYGVHEQKRGHQSEDKYGLSFPLSQSFVMSHLVLPFLPVFTLDQAASLQIKKTSWKNARKFIIALEKRKWILAKDAKSEAIVRDIDFDDRAIREFAPYRLPKREPTAGPTTNEQRPQAETNGTDDSLGQLLKLQTLYKPPGSLSAVFKGTQPTKGSYYDSPAVRQAVTRYTEAEELIVPSNRRMIKLNPQISNAVLSPSNAVDKDVLAKGTIPRDVLFERISALCQPFHVILRNEQTLGSSEAKAKAGPPPKIGIIIETRGGNKTATRVHGFEPYSINPQPLADELRKTCAGSTSVEPFKGGKGMEVMVQGPQKDAVVKALEKRGVNKQWIETSDKTKKKK